LFLCFGDLELELVHGGSPLESGIVAGKVAN